MFKRKYLFIQGPFSIAMLDYWRVPPFTFEAQKSVESLVIWGILFLNLTFQVQIPADRKANLGVGMGGERP